jgi:hypothetical protein
MQKTPFVVRLTKAIYKSTEHVPGLRSCSRLARFRFSRKFAVVLIYCSFLLLVGYIVPAST